MLAGIFLIDAQTLEEMQDAFNKLEVAAEKRIAQATRHKGDKAFHSLFSKRCIIFRSLSKSALISS